MNRLEVRCCCQPQKLRGWLEVPGEMVREGATVRVQTIRRAGAFEASRDERVTYSLRTVDLLVARFYDPAVGEHLALKSEDIPIETLRTLRGFVEKSGP